MYFMGLQSYERSKKKVTGADFQFFMLNFILKSFEIRIVTDFRPPQKFLKISLGENVSHHNDNINKTNEKHVKNY